MMTKEFIQENKRIEQMLNEEKQQAARQDDRNAICRGCGKPNKKCRCQKKALRRAERMSTRQIADQLGVTLPKPKRKKRQKRQNPICATCKYSINRGNHILCDHPNCPDPETPI